MHLLCFNFSSLIVLTLKVSSERTSRVSVLHLPDTHNDAPFSFSHVKWRADNKFAHWLAMEGETGKVFVFYRWTIDMDEWGGWRRVEVGRSFTSRLIRPIVIRNKEHLNNSLAFTVNGSKNAPLTKSGHVCSVLKQVCTSYGPWARLGPGRARNQSHRMEMRILFFFFFLIIFFFFFFNNCCCKINELFINQGILYKHILH